MSMSQATRYFCAAVPLMLAAGCVHYTPYTAKQLEEKGTFEAVGQSPENVMSALVATLETLGYRVTQADAQRGVVKTAPKSMMTSATAVGDSATVTEDGLAWAFQLQKAGNNVVVHATPRGFRNGSEMKEDNMWIAEVMDPKFADLWNELKSSLGTGGASTSSQQKL